MRADIMPRITCENDGFYLAGFYVDTDPNMYLRNTIQSGEAVQYFFPFPICHVDSRNEVKEAAVLEQNVEWEYYSKIANKIFFLFFLLLPIQETFSQILCKYMKAQ